MRKDTPATLAVLTVAAAAAAFWWWRASVEHRPIAATDESDSPEAQQPAPVARTPAEQRTMQQLASTGLFRPDRSAFRDLQSILRMTTHALSDAQARTLQRLLDARKGDPAPAFVEADSVADNNRRYQAWAARQRKAFYDLARAELTSEQLTYMLDLQSGRARIEKSLGPINSMPK